MNDEAQIIQWVAKETSIKSSLIQEVISLLNEGNTVPFIARYRKEQTSGLDEVQINTIQEKWEYGQNLSKRKEEVVRLIEEQGKLTEELRSEILKAQQLQKVEDLYRPYKQKRRTKATVAKEKGLEPLALAVWDHSIQDLQSEAKTYQSEENELHTIEDVLAGVNDILAEWISDEPVYRDYIRTKTFEKGSIESVDKNKEHDEKSIFEMYYDYSEPIRSIASHRVLALNRGEKEGVLKVAIQPPVEMILDYLHRKLIPKQSGETIQIWKDAIEDSYKRLIQPSVEREVRTSLSERAEEQAIDVFSKNLKNLLLQPPLKGRAVLGVDPAYRTGCKLSVVDETGKVQAIKVVYPTPPKNDKAGAEKVILQLMKQYPIELVAIGNGTASRETEQFIADMIQNNNLDIAYMIVNEAGASVYSASALAREEFPDLQVEERSAVSIARRVQDPLAELVKIDPKSIGVGQYQHDVSQKKLNQSLTFVVETTVNQVGVNANTASSSLLQYVSGLSKTVANNIVKVREEQGKFTNRNQLKKIPRLGAKTYEQSIGFLRLPEGEEPLDRTPIHPETYKATKQLLSRMGCSVEDLGSEKLNQQVKELEVQQAAEELDIGVPTLQDILEALVQPGRDPRDDLPTPLLKKDVLSMEDLRQGMELQGTVRNVVDFGVFVDIGVKQDGLVHISKLAKRFVKHPLDVVAVGDVVTVWVEDVDTKKERIALSMLGPSE
ncbi:MULTISPECIES: Tex family protein [Pontibacillus]|uniref:Tex family protein n=1 Tax=Pontibacillus chungwhensis TaxID=265426 RepID=A0ABY8UYF1_9BACI|nr:MULTISPECIES: Tex family protein [Pontibacillus]MCD5325861.1 RNA-binding transcriptional accessory protein [Pontibacillus sp. HN14]WIF98390.1 Tex family protein [Pontibacillus chungwhensis]